MIRFVAEAIPYKNKKERKEIVRKYHKHSVIEIWDKYVYVERIEMVS